MHLTRRRDGSLQRAAGKENMEYIFVRVVIPRSARDRKTDYQRVRSGIATNRLPAYLVSSALVASTVKPRSAPKPT